MSDPIRPAVDVITPKGPVRREGDALLAWAREQLTIAGQILDNPGGGLLFATQAMGQVRAALTDAGPARWEEAIRSLRSAEFHAVRRDLTTAREIVGRVRETLSPG